MVKKATKNDIKILALLAIKLWPEHAIDELVCDFENLLKDRKAKCFIKYCKGSPVGFAHCSLRSDYVEGTSTSPVGYLEGIYVEPDYRKFGYAKELICACEKWAKKKGCTEFASDCELKNLDSMQFHLAVGFEKANEIICFRKSIK